MNQARLARLLLKVRPAKLGSALKKLFKIGRVEFSSKFGKFWLDPASNFGARIMNGEAYEPEMTAALIEPLQSRQVFMDIGANEGYFSVLAHQRIGSFGQIICFEPQERLHEVLKRNLSLNKVENAEIVGKALGSEPGTAELNLFPDTNTGASSFASPVSYALPTQTVEITTLDAFLAERSGLEIDVAKIDIEGFEFDALQGAEQSIRDGRFKRLVIELHPPLLTQRGFSVQQMVDWLTERGMSCELVNPELLVATRIPSDVA